MILLVLVVALGCFSENWRRAMKKALFTALFGILLFTLGCGQDHGHNFFKPEVQDVTYAMPQSGDPTADDIGKYDPSQVKAELDINIRCWGPVPCIDMDGTWEGWGFVDNDAYYAAPALKRQ